MAVVAAVSTETLAVIIGAVVIAAVVLSLVASHLHPGITPTSASLTGVATGITGTAAAIDGPPLALLYQNDPPPVFRSTLATQFALGTVFTITGLLIGGELHGWQVLLGVSLIPSYFAGLAGRDLRVAILAIAALTGVAAIVRALASPIAICGRHPRHRRAHGRRRDPAGVGLIVGATRPSRPSARASAAVR